MIGKSNITKPTFFWTFIYYYIIFFLFHFILSPHLRILIIFFITVKSIFFIWFIVAMVIFCLGFIHKSVVISDIVYLLLLILAILLWVSFMLSGLISWRRSPMWFFTTSLYTGCAKLIRFSFDILIYLRAYLML